MVNEKETLSLTFDGSEVTRTKFLWRIRAAVRKFTGETMLLDALMIEIGKNIFDHAHGKGSLVIEKEGGSFKFEIKNAEPTPCFPEDGQRLSRLAGNGTNFGAGVSLGLIEDIARHLKIDLKVGENYCYTGVYTPSNLD